MGHAFSILALVATMAFAPVSQAGDLSVTRPRCEYRVNPLNVEALQPRLSWVLQSAQRGQKQTAYQVLVASSPEKLSADQGDLFNSGKVTSQQSIHVIYAGKPLQSRLQCYWKVRAWDKQGEPSPWSRPAQWTMALLAPEDWQAKWIAAIKKADAATPLPVFRRGFDVAKAVRRAELYVCGLGFHEVHLNGQKVGDCVLEPGWTNYRKSCRYSTYDVTKQIVNYAHQHDVDLIIIGTHGHSEFRRLVIGSVAEKVAHDACIPVFLVRPPECRVKL